MGKRRFVRTFSENPLIKLVQKKYEEMRLTPRIVIDNGVPKATVYKILINGAPDCDASTLLQLAKAISHSVRLEPMTSAEWEKEILAVAKRTTGKRGPGPSRGASAGRRVKATSPTKGSKAKAKRKASRSR